jgi:hypothetical protein
MAMALRFVCGNCHRAIEAWDDGNPYYIDEASGKKYAHHPDHEALARCVGNDSPHLCLACGQKFMVDSRSPAANCPGMRGRRHCQHLSPASTLPLPVLQGGQL